MPREEAPPSLWRNPSCRGGQRARACLVLSLFFSLFLPPTRTRRRRDFVRRRRVVQRVSFPPPIPPNGEKVSQFAFWWDPAVCGAISWGRGGEDGRRKKKWGPSCCHTPGQTMMMMMLHLPIPPFPSPSLFFLLLSRSVRTHRESLYTVSGFPSSSSLFCFLLLLVFVAPPFT